MYCSLQDELLDLHQKHKTLLKTVCDQNVTIANLEAAIDNLQQYSRRENVCFSNLKVDESNPCTDQVINICNELGVDVTPEDLVAAHPLPAGKKGKGKSTRVIARFKDRSMAQKVLKNRKQTKNISTEKKKALFTDQTRGMAVQPNITPKRAALLGQVKDCSEKCDIDSFWVDTKNCNIMVRKNPNAAPKPVMNTCDLLKLCPQFVPRDYILCVSPLGVDNADIFSPEQSVHG